MDATISILFYLKRAKVNAQGLAPIFKELQSMADDWTTAPASLLTPTNGTPKCLK